MSATATEKESKEEKKPSMDPFMAELAASFNQVIESDAGALKLKPMAPVDLKEEPVPPPHATQTVGEVVAERARVEEAGDVKLGATSQGAEKKDEKAEDANKEEAKAVPAKEEAKETPKTAETAKEQVKVKARGKPGFQALAEPSPVAPVPEKKEPVKEEAKALVVDDYEKGLSDGQREELDMARAAEKFLPEQYRGQPEKLLGFFKKVDEFASGHPELAPESEEFKEFVERQRPAYREGDRRRVERMQIKSEVIESTRKEMEDTLAKTTGELKRRQYEMEERPVVAKTLERFQDGLLSEVPQGVDESLAEVGKVMQEEGFAAAAAKFPIEAPIYESTVRTASEYLDLVHGLKAFNEQDSTHRWLVTFVDGQADIIRGDAERRMQNGKEFLPPNEFAILAQKDAQAARKHWTFSEQQILDMLAWNAHMAATNRIKELESAGYKREPRKKEHAVEKKSETSNLEPRTLNLEQSEKVESSLNGKSDAEKNSEEMNGTVSPRAGTTGVTGLATGKPNLSETGRFLEMLVPGGGKFSG